MAEAASQQQQVLLQAVRSGDKQTTLQLLGEGVSHNCKDSLGYTPLIWAVYYNRVEVTEVLLYNRANLDARSQGGHAALHIAVSKGSTGCVSLLCKAGANLSVRSNTGYTPLHEGSNNGKLECIRILLEYKVQINVKTNEGFTALHLAASKGNLEICQLLLDCGAAIEFSDSAGRTALHLAASCAHGKPVVDLLLACGANAAKKCMKNLTPLQYAIENNCTLSISILKLAEGQAKELVAAPKPPIYEHIPLEFGDEPDYSDNSIFGLPQIGPSVSGPTLHSSSIATCPNFHAGPNGESPSHQAMDGSNLFDPAFRYSPLATSPHYSDPGTIYNSPHPESANKSDDSEIDRSLEAWKEMERDLARKNRLVDQLRSEKMNAEVHYTQSLKQLVQEATILEAKLRETEKELDTARAAQTELDATRTKLDALVVELRTINARHARFTEHVVEMEENRLCKVCFERPVGTVLSPCSHCCLCVECTTAVEKKNKKCPICRQGIEKSTVCYFT